MNYINKIILGTKKNLQFKNRIFTTPVLGRSETLEGNLYLQFGKLISPPSFITFPANLSWLWKMEKSKGLDSRYLSLSPIQLSSNAQNQNYHPIIIQCTKSEL